MKVGDRVGRYTLRALLGKGGMGVVFKADDDMGRVVAIKFLLNGTEDRFKQEQEVLKHLSGHPCIVQYRDYGIDEGIPYLVMEYLEGESLDRRIERGPLAVREAMTIVMRVCEALSYGHGLGIIHRDIKPLNIFLTKDGGVKLLDFGLAKVVDSNASLTQAGLIIGSPPYMAIDQLRNAKDASRRDDVWSLGVVLYVCLTGRLPYPREVFSLESAQRAIADRRALPSRSGIGRSEWVILSKALAPKRDNRYQSAELMRLAIAEYLGPTAIPETVALDVQAGPPVLRPPPKPLRRRMPASRRRGIALAAALLFLYGLWYYSLYLEKWWDDFWASPPTSPATTSDEERPQVEDPSPSTDPEPSSEEQFTCSQEERSDTSVQSALDGYYASSGRCLAPTCDVGAIRRHVRNYWSCTAPDRRMKLCWLACESQSDRFRPEGAIPSECREVLHADHPCVVTAVQPTAPTP